MSLLFSALLPWWTPLLLLPLWALPVPQLTPLPPASVSMAPSVIPPLPINVLVALPVLIVPLSTLPPFVTLLPLSAFNAPRMLTVLPMNQASLSATLISMPALNAKMLLTAPPLFLTVLTMVALPPNLLVSSRLLVSPLLLWLWDSLSKKFQIHKFHRSRATFDMKAVS